MRAVPIAGRRSPAGGKVEMSEEWRDIPGYVGLYQVSDQGRVRTMTYHDRKGGRFPAAPRVLKDADNGRGYRKVCLTDVNHRITNNLIHHLVLETFVGSRGDSEVGRHLDGNPLNNAPGNLCWGTHKDNWADALGHGRVPFGEVHKNHTLSAAAVAEIHRRHAAGELHRVIADSLGCGRRAVDRIVRGERRARG